MPAPLAKGFQIDARVGGAWKTVFSDNLNILRLRKVAFTPVEALNILRLRKVSFAPVEADALRLVVTETWGQSYDKPKPRAHVFAFDAL